MKEEIIWDYNPFDSKNFICILSNKGKWRMEEGLIFGKWILLIKPKSQNPAPTFADLLNFVSGLIEVENRNDNFIFKEGNKRTQIKNLKLNDFEDFLIRLKKEYDKRI